MSRSRGNSIVFCDNFELREKQSKVAVSSDGRVGTFCEEILV